MRRNLPKKFLIIIAFACSLMFAFSACTPEISIVFGTTFELVSESGNYSLKKNMLKTLETLEQTFSTQVEGSDIFKVNAAAANEAVSVDAQTIELLKLSKELYEKSDKAYNPAIYGLVELWQFSPDTYTDFSSTFTLPSDESFTVALQYADFDKVILDEQANTVTKQDANIKIDFGAVAKGYAVGVLADMAEEKDADVLINLGGNIMATGDTSYAVAISHPRYAETTASYFAKIKLKDLAVSTSGDYERYYIKDGVRYHHIIAQNGKPSESGVISATIIGDRPALCDAIATAVVVLGLDAGSALIEEYNLSAIIITDNKTYKAINVSDLNFELVDEEYTLCE